MSSETNKVVVFTHGGGRFGNQFVNAANLLAFSLERPDVDVIDLALAPYRGAFDGGARDLASSRGSSLPLRWKVVMDGLWTLNPDHRFLFIRYDEFRCRLLHAWAEWASNAQSVTPGAMKYGGEYEDLDLAEWATSGLDKPITLIAGWGARCWPLVDKHRSAVREHLSIGDPYYSRGSAFIGELRERYDRLVGVLIRHGDYREWHDGRYYFESEQYERWLRRFELEHPEDEIGFVIASDERQERAVFRAENRVFATGMSGDSGHYLESFVELSMCDLVLTPPSTFSVCAAFLTDTPVVPLYEGMEDWEYLKRPFLDSLDHPHMGQAVW